MIFRVLLLIVATAAASSSAFGGDDRYIKKYAMMKVYESCLGPEVVKEVRKEMKAACAKCSGVSVTSPGQDVPPPRPPPPPVPEDGPDKDQQPPRKHAKPVPTAAPLSQFDAYKLQQAILGFRSQNPYVQAQAAQAQAQAQVQAQAAQVQAQSAPYRFQAPAGFYAGQFPQSFPAAQNPLYYPLGNSLYSPQPNYYQAAAPYYQFPVSPSQAYLGHRSSRDLDVRGQLETLTAHMAGSGKIRNVTCVMQELGYLDENLEPNYEKITERIGRLPVANELKRDMADGVEYCRQFAQCVPDLKRDKFPLSRELAKPMFFFRCYKHKKLEACIMKDVRERYAQSEDLNDDDPMTSGELRSLNWSKDKAADYEDMAVAMYEFLYGGDNMEFETLM